MPTITLAAECTIENTAQVKTEMMSALEQSDEIMVDLGNVRKLDCAFLQLLTAFRKTADEKKIIVTMKNSTDEIYELFTLYGIKDML